jgi:cytochrome c551/c552
MMCRAAAIVVATKALVLVAAPWSAPPAWSQSNLDAGKSPEQIFAETCSACHAHAHELKSPSAAFLRKHYTTGERQAAAMAAYVQAAIHNPPPPPPPPAPPAPKGRRPAESIETNPAATAANGEAVHAPTPRDAALPFSELEE